jgi:type II secretory pathway pseudopilin PulG
MTTVRDNAMPPRQRGFTLLEVVVATLITAEVILAALALFDFHNRLAHVQGAVTDMQQSLRVAQYEMVKLTREAGRGGLPAVVRPGQPTQTYGAVNVRNNVTSGTDQVAVGFSNTPKAVDGTDILVIRGAFTNPVLTLDPSGPGKLVLTGGSGTPATATGGTLIVCALTPTNIAQDLGSLIAAVSAAGAAGQVEPLILVGSRSDTDYAVVELNAASSVLTGAQPGCPAPGTGVLLAFNITGDANANAFQQLGAVTGTAGLPPQMSAAATLGILEEYRYYIRQDAALNTLGDPVRHLSRARMYPGTETPYYNDPTNLQVDVADNLFDLQVALGLDFNGDGLITEGGNGIPPSALPATATDDWIYNVAGDTPFPMLPSTPPLLEVRINTLATTGNPDPAYQGPKLTAIEDHTYLATDFPNTFHGRCYRHRLLTTVVGLRNL